MGQGHFSNRVPDADAKLCFQMEVLEHHCHLFPVVGVVGPQPELVMGLLPPCEGTDSS